MMVANFYRPLLDEFASKLFDDGKTLNSPFNHRLNLNSSEGASFWRYLSFIWTELFKDDCLLKSSMVAKEIEDSLYAMFVYASENPCRLLLGRYNDGSLLGHARRAEAYVMENLQESISAVDIAHAAKISYPTLYRTFIKHKNTSPMPWK